MRVNPLHYRFVVITVADRGADDDFFIRSEVDRFFENISHVDLVIHGFERVTDNTRYLASVTVGGGVDEEGFGRHEREKLLRVRRSFI